MRVRQISRRLILAATAVRKFPVSWAGEARSPVWFDVARELTERWHHQQQIRDAVGADPLTTREFLHPVLDTFMRALPFASRHVTADDGTLWKVEIGGPAGGYLVPAPRGWSLAARRGRRCPTGRDGHSGGRRCVAAVHEGLRSDRAGARCAPAWQPGDRRGCPRDALYCRVDLAALAAAVRRGVSADWNPQPKPGTWSQELPESEAPDPGGWSKVRPERSAHALAGG